MGSLKLVAAQCSEVFRLKFSIKTRVPWAEQGWRKCKRDPVCRWVSPVFNVAVPRIVLVNYSGERRELRVRSKTLLYEVPVALYAVVVRCSFAKQSCGSAGGKELGPYGHRCREGY